MHPARSATGGRILAILLCLTTTGVLLGAPPVRAADVSIQEPDETVFGEDAGNAGSSVAFFGANAGANNTGNRNAFFGQDAGRSNTEGSQNAFFGRDAGFNNTTGSFNAFFGRDAGRSNTTGSKDAFFGESAGRSNTTGFDNAFFGQDAGFSNTTGTRNAFVGQDAGTANTTGHSNSFFGQDAGFSNTEGFFNAFFGQEAGFKNTTGSANAFFGQGAGFSNTTGDTNVFFGEGAGLSNTTGSANAFFGQDAGFSNTDEGNNTFLGAGSDLGTPGITNATAVGAKAQVDQSNSLVLGSIDGVNFATASTRVGIGTTAPDRDLHVAASSDPGLRLEETGSGQAWDLEVLDDLALTDATASTTPFRIRPGAPTSSIDIAASGNVGIGTSSPDKNLHVEGASNPGIRLRDSGSGQAWDIESHDGLSLKDVTANTKPVTVETGAPNDALVVDESGNVGVGTNNPGRPLTVDATNDSAGKEQVLQLLNNGPAGLELNNTTAGVAWRYAMDTKNRFVVSRAGSGGAEFLIGKNGEVFMGRPFKFFLRPNGNLEIAGTLTEGSDRAAKTDIAQVDPSGLLTTLRGLPISTWFYAKAPGEAHLGPMAQDFHELFGLGNDPTKISPRDMAGVALATIQALDADVQAKDARIASLENEVDELREESDAKDVRFDQLEERLERLEAASAE